MWGLGINKQINKQTQYTNVTTKIQPGDMRIPDLLVSFHSSEQPHHLMVRMMVMIVEVGDDDDD